MGKGPQKNKEKVAWIGVQRICLLCLIFLILQPAIVEAPIPFNPPAEELSLIAGSSIERELPAEKIHSYNFKLSQQTFLRIDFYSPNIDLLVSIALPGGNESLKWLIIKRGTAPIACVLDSKSSYLLRIQGLEKNGYSGSYRMEIKASQPVGAQDHRQVAACRYISNAAQYRRQWTEATLRSAIREYEEALRLWKGMGDLEQEAITLKNTGDVWETFAEWKQALSCYEKAQAAYRQLEDLSGETEVINVIGVLYINRGEYKKALDIYAPTHIATEDPWQRAQIFRNFGAASWGMTELSKAAGFLNQALDMQKQLQDWTAQADALLYLGYVSHAMKDITAAEQYYERSHDLFRKAENPRGVALALTALAELSSLLGERQRAMDYFDRSLKIFETIGEQSGRYLVFRGMAELYVDLGENDKALQNYQTALALIKQVGDLAFEADTLSYIGALYRNLGHHKKALEYCERAVEINRSLPSPQAEAYALLNLAKTQEALGKREAAVKSYARGLELSQKAKDRFLEGHLSNALGQLHHGSGQLLRALGYYRQALSLQREANDSVGMRGTLYNLARAERDAGNLERAKQYAERGLEITESLRGKVASPELRGSYLASVYQQYELMIDLLMQLHAQQPFGQLEAEALKISEQARARSLLDMLAETQADIREGVDSDLLELERSLQKKLSSKAEMQMQLNKRKHSKEEEDSLAEEIDLIVTEYQEVQARIRSRSPHYAALTQPRTLNLLGIQQLVDEETILLEYELGEVCSYLWVVTPATLRSHVLPKRAEIETRVHRVRELMLERQNSVEETNDQYQKRIRNADTAFNREAAALSRILLGSVADQLASKRLLIVADGILQYLPFAALPKPDLAGNDESKDPSYLIAEHEIVNIPSASVLGVLRQETAQRSLPRNMVAVLADPVFEADDPRIGAKVSSIEPAAASPLASRIIAATPLQRAIREMEGGLSRLPSTRDEADSVMALIPEGSGLKLLDFNANRTVALGSELGQYQIVHFGTHGFINDENPEVSGLALSLFDEQGRPQDGYLWLNDIYNLKLPAELVVLSACDSALGKEVRGEGLVGLVRGFMYAGAKRIMASLWKVDDKPTAALMKLFYQHMLQDGETPARALQMAQLEMSKQKRWQAPCYWAAFILQGEWN